MDQAVCISIVYSFALTVEYFIAWMYLSLLIHSHFEGHLGHFQFLVIVNNVVGGGQPRALFNPFPLSGQDLDL